MYWLTLEWLYQNADAVAEYDISSLSFYLHETEEDTKEFLDYCISQGLLISDKSGLFSLRLKEHKEKQIEKSEQARANVLRRYNKRNYGRTTSRVKKSRVEDSREEKSKEENKSIVANATATDKSLAEEMAKGLMEANPAFYQKYSSKGSELRAKIDKWAEDIEKMKRIDNVTDEQISAMIAWLYYSDEKDAVFWRGNIQSGDKLRKQFPRLVSAIEREAKSGNKAVFIS